MTDTPCPWINGFGRPCEGVMVLQSVEVTTMGRLAAGVDPNRFGEAWTCQKCARSFGRTYKWDFMK